MAARKTMDFLRNAHASATVEFVAVVPVLLAALAFSFEFGRALWAYDVMTRDLRAGVRYLSRAAGSVAGPNCPAAATTFVTNGTAASAHFPWTLGIPTFICSSAPGSPFTGFNQSANVVVMTATVTINDSLTSTLLTFLNTVSGGNVAPKFQLHVSDQARLVGN